MGSDSRCNHHVHWSGHACLCLGHYFEWLGHLLCMVPVLLRHRCWWRISHDGNIWNGECRGFWQGLNKGRSSSPRPQSYQRFLDAGMGAILQPVHSHCCPSVLPPRKREPSILGSGGTMDIPYLFCHTGRRYALAGVFSYVQDESRKQAIGRSKEEVQGHRVRHSVPQAYFLLLRPSHHRNRWRLVLQ